MFHIGKVDVTTGIETGYGKSSLELGKKVHKEYMSDVADGSL